MKLVAKTDRWRVLDGAIRAGRALNDGETFSLTWWPELAPLTPHERRHVIRLLTLESQEGKSYPLPSEMRGAPGADGPHKAEPEGSTPSPAKTLASDPGAGARPAKPRAAGSTPAGASYAAKESSHG